MNGINNDYVEISATGTWKEWLDSKRPAAAVPLIVRVSAQSHTVGRSGSNAYLRMQPMTKRITVYVGMDVHQESIEIALADGRAGGE